MNEREKCAISLASLLLEYPDDEWLGQLDSVTAAAADGLSGSDADTVAAFCAALREAGPAKVRQEFVRFFDHDPETSPYLAWHRYGNDRGQGRALAALNGLYRAAGFEPEYGALPDYLPLILEFLSVCEDWAREALLDGFGAELAKISQALERGGSRHAPILKMALAPLMREWPGYFLPRNLPDPTIRPMARPERETRPGEDYFNELFGSG